MNGSLLGIIEWRQGVGWYGKDVRAKFIQFGFGFQKGTCVSPSEVDIGISNVLSLFPPLSGWSAKYGRPFYFQGSCNCNVCSNLTAVIYFYEKLQFSETATLTYYRSGKLELLLMKRFDFETIQLKKPILRHFDQSPFTANRYEYMGLLFNDKFMFAIMSRKTVTLI